MAIRLTHLPPAFGVPLPEEGELQKRSSVGDAVDATRNIKFTKPLPTTANAATSLDREALGSAVLRLPLGGSCLQSRLRE